jgi:hypothetical protein
MEETIWTIIEVIEVVGFVVASGIILCHFMLVVVYNIGFTKNHYEAVRRSMINYYGTDDLSKFTPEMLKNLQENAHKFSSYGNQALKYGEIEIVKKKDPPHRIHIS